AAYAVRKEQGLSRLGGIPGIGLLAPEGGFFVMVDTRALPFNSAEIRKRLLYEHDVALMHGSAYGPGGEGTLRVSFATGGEALTRGLDRLHEGLVRIAESKS